MRLMSARVIGFQLFADTGKVEFDEGINLIIGQNNAGKSALLRALLPNIPDDRHRSPAEWRDLALPIPSTEFFISVSGRKLKDGVFTSGQQLIVPAPDQPAADSVPFVENILSRDELKVRVTRQWNSVFSAQYPSHQLLNIRATGRKQLLL